MTYLKSRQMLLVLDNFEHLISAGQEIVALLSRCPGLKTLITSREVLNMRGEYGYSVPSLSLPTDELVGSGGSDIVAMLKHSDAVGLFLDRAAAAKPDFELTGANAACFCPEQAVWIQKTHEEIDNIRATLGWCAKHDRESAFRIATELWFFWHILGIAREGVKWLDYPLEFENGTASEHLAAAKAYASFLAVTIGELDRAEELAESAMSRARANTDLAGEATSLHFLGYVPYFRGNYHVSSGLFAECLAYFRNTEDYWFTANSIRMLGLNVGLIGDYGRSAELLSESLEMSRKQGDGFTTAYVLFNWAFVALDQGDYGKVQSLCRESLVLLRETTDKLGIIRALEKLAVSTAIVGNRSKRAARFFGIVENLRNDIGWPGGEPAHAKHPLGRGNSGRGRCMVHNNNADLFLREYRTVWRVPQRLSKITLRPGTAGQVNMSYRFEINIDYPPEKMTQSKMRMETRGSFQYVDRVAVNYCLVARYFAPLFGLRYIDFFKDAETQFYWQLQFEKYRIENIPEDHCCGPTLHIHPYFDNAVPPSGHGAEVGWDDDNPIRALPVIHTVDEMERFEIAEPNNGLRGTAIEWWLLMKELAAQTRVTFNEIESPIEVGALSLAGLSPHMIAIDLVGEDFYWWMLEHPDACHRFLDKITRGEIAAEENARRIDPRPRGNHHGIAEDSAQIMSAEMFKAFCVPYSRILFEKYGTEGRGVHMCGDSRHLLDSLKEDLKITSFDIFGYLVPPKVIAEKLGGTTLLWGNINPMLMLNGTEEEVKQAATICLEEMGSCGGLMLGDGANVCPGTPLASFQAIMEAAEEFGRPRPE